LTSDIVLAAINARYTHTSLASRYLYANLGALQPRCTIREFTINDAPESIAAEIVALHPTVVGLGVYIWNRLCMERLVPCLREALPNSRIVLGGPEITHDAESDLANQADSIICGEGDIVFAEVCQALLTGDAVPRRQSPPPTDVASLTLPYDDYASHDMEHRAVYFESSRGCPHRCEFCLSSLDSGVRKLPEEEVHAALDHLLEAGVRNLRVVDRSFNLGGTNACRLLDHLLSRTFPPGFRLHIELTPDELSPAIRSRLTKFPEGTLHVEVGIQTLNPEVSARVGRPIDPKRVEEGLCFLTHDTHAAVHADLIAGLPGETPESVVSGFDQLYASGPHEIQLGILKCLRGTPIVRHTQEWGLRFRNTAPYDILETSTMPTEFLETVRRFASHWDRVVNRNHLPRTVSRMLDSAPSPWRTFDSFSQQLAATHGTHGIDLVDLCASLLDFIPSHCKIPRDETLKLLREDYLADGKRMTIPAFLRK